jgi:hypothetical protein
MKYIISYAPKNGDGKYYYSSNFMGIFSFGRLSDAKIFDSRAEAQSQKNQLTTGRRKYIIEKYPL